MRFKELTQDQISFLKKQNGVARKEVWKLFNVKYSASVPYTTIVQWLQKVGTTAPISRFSKGHKPWNKNMSTEEYREHFSDEEWISMTNRVLNAKHHRNKIGDVKVIKDCRGNNEPWIVVKTGKELTTYQKLCQLDRFIWEKKCGKIPQDCAIVHLNKNSLDCRIDNLAVIKKSWIGMYMRWMASDDAEINKTTIKWLTLRDALKNTGGLNDSISNEEQTP